MTFIVGLCGAHGTGKSTIIKQVKVEGYPVDESQLSRAAQKALGWESLAEAQKSEENMWALQDEILNAMYDRDLKIHNSQIITLVDRTPADVWAYVEMWMEKLGGKVDQQRAYRYKQKCRTMAASYRRHMFVPIRTEIPFIAEAGRADEASQFFHSIAVYEFILSGNLPSSIIQTLDPVYRAHEVIYHMGEKHEQAA